MSERVHRIEQDRVRSYNIRWKIISIDPKWRKGRGNWRSEFSVAYISYKSNIKSITEYGLLHSSFVNELIVSYNYFTFRTMFIHQIAKESM